MAIAICEVVFTRNLSPSLFLVSNLLEKSLPSVVGSIYRKPGVGPGGRRRVDVVLGVVRWIRTCDSFVQQQSAALYRNEDAAIGEDQRHHRRRIALVRDSRRNAVDSRGLALAGSNPPSTVATENRPSNGATASPPSATSDLAASLVSCSLFPLRATTTAMSSIVLRSAPRGAGNVGPSSLEYKGDRSPGICTRWTTDRGDGSLVGDALSSDRVLAATSPSAPGIRVPPGVRLAYVSGTFGKEAPAETRFVKQSNAIAGRFTSLSLLLATLATFFRLFPASRRRKRSDTKRIATTAVGEMHSVALVIDTRSPL